MDFTVNTGGFISLEIAAQMTASHRNSMQEGGLISLSIGSNLILPILEQPGCVGLRMYKAINESGNEDMVLVGVDSNGDDMSSGLIADRMIPRPMVCPSKSLLNSKGE